VASWSGTSLRLVAPSLSPLLRGCPGGGILASIVGPGSLRSSLWSGRIRERAGMPDRLVSFGEVTSGCLTHRLSAAAADKASFHRAGVRRAQFRR